MQIPRPCSTPDNTEQGEENFLMLQMKEDLVDKQLWIHLIWSEDCPKLMNLSNKRV